MRRIFWLAAGLGAGATAVVAVNRWAKRQRARIAPANLGRQAQALTSDLVALVGEAAKDFKAGAAEREAEIRASLERQDRGGTRADAGRASGSRSTRR